MKRLLTRAHNDGYRVLYIDETCFTRTSMPKVEWCRPKENAAVDLVNLQEPTLTVLAAISKDKGLEFYRTYEKSVNTQKFKSWLT